MARYRKKPVVIEAIQWDGLNLEEIRRFVGSSLVYQIFDAAWKAGAGQPVVDMKIKTLEGEMQVGRGDYIIKGVRGEFYPCKPDIFKETYESADTADVAPKSEVEELKVRLELEQKAHESLKELYRIDTDALVEARRKTEVEVAREIFEEIEKVSCRISESNQNGFLRVVCYQLSAEKFAELKKKCMEGKI